MKLSEVLQIVNIVIEMEGRDKDEIIKEMVHIAARNRHLRHDLVTKAIMQRESRKSSNYGNGIALPHSSTLDCEEVAASLAILKQPVDWKSDYAPVDIVLLVVGSHRQVNSYINLIAKGAKVIGSDAFREGVKKAKSVQEIHDLIKKIETKFNYA